MQTSTARLPSVTARPAGFALTRWSVVLAAGRGQAQHAQRALEQLCATYWPPIYSFLRRQGYSPHDSEDLTQEFFARLLQKNSLGAVDRAKGRFRSFLLASLKHFLANEWDKAKAQKRGGGKVLLSVDAGKAETSYRVEPVELLTPDKIYERRWALTLLERVLNLLRSEYAAHGKPELFQQLKGTLSGDSPSESYAVLAQRLGASEGAIKVAVHRLRQRYRDLLRAEIAQTVSSPEEIEEEIRALFAAL
ncbi:MAG TPA: sigma-70 family RNA polymerase sigma factor [Verrucomicrobiae bacterium]|nr:sigma-70 family RNA polymerase sigma factor [Verrucomicrobiae bacterium]